MYGRQLDLQQHQSALTLIDNLLTELKRLDDKMILTEVHLLESRVYRGIGNFPKAKVIHFSISSVFSLMIILRPHSHLHEQLQIPSTVHLFSRLPLIFNPASFMQRIRTISPPIRISLKPSRFYHLKETTGPLTR